MELTISWGTPTSCLGYGGPLLSYVVQYREEESSIFTDSEPTESASLLEHRVTGLSPNTSYQLRVAARNAQGVGTYSDIVMATTHAIIGQLYIDSWKPCMCSHLPNTHHSKTLL